MITYRALEILFYTPWTYYQNFHIDKKFELSESTYCSFIYTRIAMLLEYILLPIPVILFIVKVMEWSGDYLILVFFCATGLVKLFLMWVYPRLIAPIFSKYEDLGSIAYAMEIMPFVQETCKNVGYKPS